MLLTAVNSSGLELRPPNTNTLADSCTEAANRQRSSSISNSSRDRRNRGRTCFRTHDFTQRPNGDHDMVMTPLHAEKTHQAMKLPITPLALNLPSARI